MEVPHRSLRIRTVPIPRCTTGLTRARYIAMPPILGLLAVRPVRGVVGATLSLLFSQVVEKSDPDAGDGYDLWHALLASTADVFITRDGRLAKRLSRIPMDDFRVVSSISPLLTL